jgi:hypothetical protein
MKLYHVTSQTIVVCYTHSWDIHCALCGRQSVFHSCDGKLYMIKDCVPYSHILANGVSQGVAEGILEQDWG